eukprot:c25573_g1_i1.p1 GENE.c25573_g1_i1~~c25573_g1_i1.p1  ORF type:complete len:409 (-),score=58.00 c25573_g1_i1:37-1263(-)
MYFTGNVRYETQGLLSPRSSREKSPRLHGIEFLRFLAAVHLMFGEIFPGKHDETLIRAMSKNIRDWGFSGFAFFCMLSGFVLAYNYGPVLNDSCCGFNLRHFWMKRLCWLFPLYFVALFLPVWADPFTYLGSFSRVMKFLATLFGLTGWWPPAFRNYHLNDNAWMVSSFLLFYVLIFPLLLKPIHTTLSRVARQWLLLFLWPWTWFVGFVAERIDEASNDYGAHWDWGLPVLYIPAFLMGLLLGSIFAERNDADSDVMSSFADRFAGLVGFGILGFVYLFAKPEPMLNWHQTGSLLLLQAMIVYYFAKGKDVLGMIFSLMPFRFLGGFAFPIIILMHPVKLFATQIESVAFKVSFVSSLVFLVLIGRLMIEIPYARWSLKFVEEIFGDKEEVVAAAEVPKASTPKEEA